MITAILAVVVAAAPIPVRDFTQENISATAQMVVDQVNAGEKHLLFDIDSFGGSVFGGMKLIKLVNKARRHGIRTTCVVDGSAMSMGFVFLQAACDVRIMTEGSLLLAHNGSTGGEGTVEQIEEQVGILKAINKALATVCARRMGMSVRAFEARIARSAWTMAWDEALASHAVDQVVSVHPLSL